MRQRRIVANFDEKPTPTEHVRPSAYKLLGKSSDLDTASPSSIFLPSTDRTHRHGQRPVAGRWCTPAFGELRWHLNGDPDDRIRYSHVGAVASAASLPLKGFSRKGLDTL